MMHVFPKGNDRSWTREFYRAINAVMRRMEYENRPRIEAETRRRLMNFYIYGTTHPEIYKP